MKTADTDTYQLWPLILVIKDCYVPESAGYAIEAVQSMPEEAFSLLWGFAGDEAREDVTLN